MFEAEANSKKDCNPMPACSAAAAYGIDLLQLEYNLSLTPAERLKQHEAALALVIAAREAGIQYYGFDPRSVETS
jgi:hypothetical protein